MKNGRRANWRLRRDRARSHGIIGWSVKRRVGRGGGCGGLPAFDRYAGQQVAPQNGGSGTLGPQTFPALLEAPFRACRSLTTVLCSAAQAPSWLRSVARKKAALLARGFVTDGYIYLAAQRAHQKVSPARGFPASCDPCTFVVGEKGEAMFVAECQQASARPR